MGLEVPLQLLSCLCNLLVLLKRPFNVLLVGCNLMSNAEGNVANDMQEDWIGLRQLDEAGRVLLEECPGQHMHVTSHWFGTYVIQAHLRT